MRSDRLRQLEPRLHLAFSAFVVALAAAAFYGPALVATRGDWPAPLDDVFIHFDFARAAARGAPFQWIAGQGFSSGETAPLYPLILAVGYAIGFRGLALGAWAAIVACASLVVAARAVRELVAPSPWWVAWIGSALVVSVGVVDWSWFSGMEVAPFFAATARALAATKRAREAMPADRARAQLRAGAWCAAMVLLRPEAAVIVAPLAVIAARRAGAASAIGALARVAGPAAIATVAVLATNAWLTGDPRSAGARLKLLSANPYLSDVDRARELVMNLVHLKLKVLDATPSTAWLVPALAAAGLFARRTRALAAAILASAVAFALLVSWNGAARYQNFRYYAPAIALLLVGATLGIAAIARARPRAARVVAALSGLSAIALATPRLPEQIALFRDAAENVHDQQVEVGRRLARRMAPDARVLVGDAGAIPYVADRGAIDALGLGGYRGVPFVEAAPFGEAATIELLERLAPAERPAWLALYPNWFARTTALFGAEVDHVTIARNVICGGPTKGIYAADWSALDAADPDDDVESLDVADVVSERAHAYASPAPDGGWTVLDVRATPGRARLFDGGRIVPDGRCERFVATRDTRGRARVALRTDAEVDATIAIEHLGHRFDAVPIVAAAPPPGAWSTARAPLPWGIAIGDLVSLCARAHPLRDFHVWIVPERVTATGAVHGG